MLRAQEDNHFRALRYYGEEARLKCYFCSHVLNEPQPEFKKLPRDPVGGPSLGAVQDVKCIYCGTEYEINILITRHPNISVERLRHIANDEPSPRPLRLKHYKMQ